MSKRKSLFERMNDVLKRGNDVLVRGARCVEFCNYCGELCDKTDMILWRGSWFCSKECIVQSRRYGGPSKYTWGS